MNLTNFLFPSSINLALSAHEDHAALAEVMSLLEHDDRISNWEEFSESIAARQVFSFSSDEENKITIYHGRSSSIENLVLAVGRTKEKIFTRESSQPIGLIFVVGIPNELSNEYLRLIGSIARICKNQITLKKLLTAKNIEDFITMLSDEEN